MTYCPPKAPIFKHYHTRASTYTLQGVTAAQPHSKSYIYKSIWKLSLFSPINSLLAVLPTSDDDNWILPIDQIKISGATPNSSLPYTPFWIHQDILLTLLLKYSQCLFPLEPRMELFYKKSSMHV